MSESPALRQNRGDSASETEARRQGQEDVSRVLTGLLLLLSRGVLVPSVALASGTNVVAHGLGHAPERWFTLSPNAAATVHETARDAQTISLTASAAVTVDLVVL